MLRKLANWLEDTTVQYVTCKEDIHELTYQQAGNGGMQRKTFIALGSIFRIGYMIVFLYFVYENYMTLRYNQEFLSLSFDAGDCHYVPKTYVFPSLSADYDGHWEGEEEFEEAKSAYRFELYDFSATELQYKEFMGEMRDAIFAMGEKGKSHNLAINLLFWSFWQHDIPRNDEVQRLSMAGDPAYIFDLDQLQGTISSVNCECETNETEKFYDLSRNELVMVFSAARLASSDCANILDPAMLGYHKTVTEDVFTLEVDVESALSAIAINYDVNHVRDLIDVYTLLENITYRGTTYRVEVKYNDEFPRESHLYCLGPASSFKDEDDWHCVLRFGDTYGIPFFQHFGTNHSHPQPCICGENGNSKECNDFSFIVGVMLYDHSKEALYNGTLYYPEGQYNDEERAFLPILEFFYGGPLGDAKSAVESNEAVYHAAWLSISHAEADETHADNYRNNNSYRKASYSFSNTTFGTASLVTFHAHSKYGAHGINYDSFQMTNGSCTDSYVTDGFHSLIDRPWGPLHEVYFQCTNWPFDAFFNGVGIASGTVGTFLPIIVFTIMTLYMCPSVVAGKSYKAENDAVKDEKEKERERRDRIHPTEAYKGDNDGVSEMEEKEGGRGEGLAPVPAEKTYIGDKKGDITMEELQWRIDHFSKGLDEMRIAMEKMKIQQQKAPSK